MEKIPNGGFPPIVLKTKNIKKNIERLFYSNDKNKININQILNINIKKSIIPDNNEIIEINTI